MENKINCEHIPAVFFSNKNAAKQYFRQYGRIRRMIFRPRSQSCSVEYYNRTGALNALTNAGEYEGVVFTIEREDDLASKSKKRRASQGQNLPHSTIIKSATKFTTSFRSVKDPDPDWLDDPDVRAELEAMGGVDYEPLKKYDLRQEAMLLEEPEPIEKVPPKREKATKLRRTWKMDSPKPVSKKKISTTSKQLELTKIIKQQTLTLEDKFKVLDARDKMIRLFTKKTGRKKDAKSRPTVGKCPDMCPEKERILRQMQHQVALYEQEFAGRDLNPSLAVKQYSRSSADQESPLPHELRPVAVLQMTMAYLMHQIMSLGDTPNVNFAEWFHFLWDRTRGIRKDITQQELCSQGSVQLVEQCARFHIHCSARLVAEDPAVFDQKINTENLTKCLQSLKYMYNDLWIKGEACPNEAEFRAYIILLNLNDGNFMWEVQQLRQEIQKSQEVQFALSIYSAIDKNNYVRFFKLVHLTTYLNACILMRYFVQVRTKAIKTFVKSFSPRIPHTLFPLTELTKILAFEELDSTVEFLETYGLIVNTEKTHVILDRLNFKLPEYPYQLDRAINIVESKRACSVGETVCGSKLPPKDFEYHIPEDSFDGKGYFVVDKYLKEAGIKINLDQLEGFLSEEDFGTDELDRRAIDEEEERRLLDSPDVSDSELDDAFKSSRKEGESENKFSRGKASPSMQKLSQSMFSGSKSIFGYTSENKHLPNKSMKSSIFAAALPTFRNNVENNNLGDPIFGLTVPHTGIFGRPVQTGTGDLTAKSQTNLSHTTSVTFSSKSLQGVFKPASQFENSTPIGSTATNIFQMSKQPPQATVDSKSRIEKLKKEELEKQVRLKKEIEETQRKLELEKQKLLEQQELLIYQKKQEELAKAKKEEERQRQLEEERIRQHYLEEERIRQRLLEQETIRQRLLEQERLKQQELLKRKQQEEEQKRLEIERKKLEEAQRELERQALIEAEISRTIKDLMEDVVTKVEEQLKQEKLAELTLKIRNRFVRKYIRVWHSNASRNKRKRKAVDLSPCWIYSKSVDEYAKELSMNSQDMTLGFIKRYRRGKPFDLNPLEDDDINKIDIHNLIHKPLVTRLYEFDTIINQNIYWKVAISIPDSDELENGLIRMESVLDKYIQWEHRVNHTLLIEQVKVNVHHTVTYCIEKQQGITEGANDSNGYIFIAKSFNTSLCHRIIESLKNFGVYVKIPIVIVLQEYNGDKTALQKLIDEEIVSDYTILVDNFSPNSLIHILEQSLIFLASKSEKASTLEMDTLKSFLNEYLCNDIWKRVSSFSKWNTGYKNSLKDPNIIIQLYNECVSKLKEIVFNKAYFEYARFPEVFKNFLNSDIPNSLPCDYRYFPDYWTDPSYIKFISDIMEHLYLPKFDHKWPQDTEFELELAISKYCTKAFKQPEKAFYKIMSVILIDIDPNVNFEDIRNVSWVSIIEVLATEKINETDFSLNATKFKNRSVFNQATVVYDPKILCDYKVTDWFYTNNPLIKKVILNEDIIEDKGAEDLKLLDSVDVNYDLDKALSDLLHKDSNKEKALKFEKDMKDFNVLCNDLEKSIELGKQISVQFENILHNIIEEN